MSIKPSIFNQANSNEKKVLFPNEHVLLSLVGEACDQTLILSEHEPKLEGIFVPIQHSPKFGQVFQKFGSLFY
jgi:hypothetical protein